MSAEDVVALCVEQFPGTGRARVLLPEGRERAARHAVRASSRRRASSRSTRTTSSRRRTSSGARSSSATTRRSRCSKGRAPRSSPRRTARSSGRRKPDLYLAIAKVEPLVRALGGLDALDHRRPPRPVADARERAEARLGRAHTSSGRRTRSPTGATTTAGRTSASAGCPTTRCTTAATRRSATRTRRSRAPAARAAGPAATGPSAASTSRSRAHEPVDVAPDAVASRRARVRGDPHHARGRRRA